LNQQNTENAGNHRRRMDVILSEEYLAELETIELDELKQKRSETEEVETEISYIRRLAQARVDLFEAEKRRRVDGSSMADLVAMLPKILAGNEERSEGGSVRPQKSLGPNPNIQWNRGKETIVVDDSLSNIADLTEDELTQKVAELKEFEDNISKTRKALHEVMQSIDSEFVKRHKSVSDEG
jgi:hypothetical protein